MKKILIPIFLLLCPLFVNAGGLMMVGWGVEAAAGGTETIGQESQQGSSTGAAANYMYCYKMEENPSHDGSVDSIKFTLSGQGANSCEVQLLIYTHDAVNDLPATVLANSKTSTQTTGTGATDITVTYSGTKPAVTSGTQYWVCFNSTGNPGNVAYYYTDTAGPRTAYKSITYDTSPDWAGSAGGTLTFRLGKAYFVNSW